MEFIKLPISDENGKQLNPIRVPTADIKDYREWLSSDASRPQTVFFFKRSAKRKRLIADISVDDVDSMFNVRKAE